MILLLNVSSFKKSVFNEILYEKVIFLKSSFKKRYVILIILNYLNKKGNKFLAELIMFRLLFLLKKTSLFNTKYLFVKHESCIYILDKAFFNIAPSFKIIVKTKRKYSELSFSDLIKDHSLFLSEKSFIDETHYAKYSQNRLKKLKSLPASKNPSNLIVNTKVIPVPLNFSSKCLKGCSFLFKSAALYKDTFDFAEKLYKEIVLAYYYCGRSFYLRTEVDKIACVHKSNIKF